MFVCTRCSWCKIDIQIYLIRCRHCRRRRHSWSRLPKSVAIALKPIRSYVVAIYCGCCMCLCVRIRFRSMDVQMVVLMHIALCHLLGWHCQLYPIYTAFLCLCLYLCLHSLWYAVVLWKWALTQCIEHFILRWTVEFSITDTIYMSHPHTQRHTQTHCRLHLEYWLYMILFKCLKWIFDVKCQRNRNLLSAFRKRICNDALHCATHRHYTYTHTFKYIYIF